MLNLLKKSNTNSNTGWKEVIYPPPVGTGLFRFLIISAFIILETWFFIKINSLIPPLYINLPTIYRSISFNVLISIFTILVWGFAVYKSVKTYVNLKNKNKSDYNKKIENNLIYLIHTLKLYDKEEFEIEERDRTGKVRVKKEKRIVRAIRMYYKKDDNKVYVRIAKLGDRFTQVAPTLGENIESTLGLELDRTNSTVDYFEYIFLKFRDKRIDLASSINNQQKNSDVIQISGNISYKLSKTPHSLIVGGTGSGKSFFILGKIVSYLSLLPQAELYVIDPKSADLSLLRFVEGFENKVATEPNQIARMLREVVQIMEGRYKTFFNDISAFGKDYTDFSLPPIIIVFDEFSAFLHSVDKKLSKEVLDYIFTIVMKGRQAGVQVEILMQRPSADDLPTNIRAQMGFKAGLGAMDKIGYNMIFDTNDIDYKTVTKKGGGYIQIDGVHTAPVYFETPYIDKDFDFIKEIGRLMKFKNEKQS